MPQDQVSLKQLVMQACDSAKKVGLAYTVEENTKDPSAQSIAQSKELLKIGLQLAKGTAALAALAPGSVEVVFVAKVVGKVLASAVSGVDMATEKTLLSGGKALITSTEAVAGLPAFPSGAEVSTVADRVDKALNTAGAGIEAKKDKTLLSSSKAAAAAVGLTTSTETIAAEAREVSQDLNDADVLFDLSRTALSYDWLPKVSSATIEQLRVEQEGIQEQQFLEFNQSLDVLPMQQAAMLKKMLLGSWEHTLDHEIGVEHLKKMGIGLHSLSQKEELVEVFTRACNNYKPSVNPSASSVYLKAALSTAPAKPKTFVDHLTPYVTTNNISEERLKLLTSADFPNNIDRKKFEELDPETIALCDPAKLRLEVARVQVELMATNGGKILPKDELRKLKQEEASENAEYNLAYSLPLDLVTLAERRVLLEKVNIADVISADSIRHAHHLQVVGMKPSESKPDEVLNKKMEVIIDFLNTSKGKGSLVDSIMKELQQSSVSTSLQDGLKDCYSNSRQSFLYTLSPSKLDRGTALDFYKEHLSDNTNRNKVLSQFKLALDKEAVPNEFPMAKIAYYLGLLNPEKDQKEIAAYKEILSEMRQKMRQAIIQTADNEELSRQYDPAMELVANMSKSSFESRGTRKEQVASTLSEYAGYAKKASSAAVIAAKVSLISPVTAVASAALVATGAVLSATSVGLNLATGNYNPDAEAALSSPQSSNEEAEERYNAAIIKVNKATLYTQKAIAQINKMRYDSNQEVSPEELMVAKEICESLMELNNELANTKLALIQVGPIVEKSDEENLQKTEFYISTITSIEKEFEKTQKPITDAIRSKMEEFGTLQEQTMRNQYGFH